MDTYFYGTDLLYVCQVNRTDIPTEITEFAKSACGDRPMRKLSIDADDPGLNVLSSKLQGSHQFAKPNGLEPGICGGFGINFGYPYGACVDGVIEKLVDYALRGDPYPLPPMAQALATNGANHDGPAPASGHPSLKHTRLLEVAFDGVPIEHPSWNDLAKHAHIVGRKRLGSFEALRAATHANIRNGQYDGPGFVYLKDADVSVQGMDADKAWDSAQGIAKAINARLSAVVLWRDKLGAANPGQTMRLEWPSN
jgi:hypothetical protein